MSDNSGGRAFAARSLLLLIAVSACYGQTSPKPLVERGHYKRALPVAEERLRTYPQDADALWSMSWLKQRWGDLNAAMDFAEKAVQAAPKNPDCHMRLADVCRVTALKAGVFRQLTLARRGKKAAEAALALQPGNASAHRFLIEFHFHAPAIIGGDKEEGTRLLEQLMRVDPVAGYLAQVWLANQREEFERIEALYRNAVEAQPNRYEVRVAFANYCLTHDAAKFEEAEKHAREAVRLDPDRIGGQNAFAMALANLRKWPDLEKALANSEKQIPDNLTPYYRAAEICSDAGVELTRAERYLRKYIVQEPEPDMPNLARGHRQLGQVLEKRGQQAEAVSEYRIALKLDPASQARNDLKRLNLPPN